MGCRTASSSLATTNNNHRFRAPRSPNALAKSIPAHLRGRPVYSYIVTTIETTSNFRLIQHGNAPNFDGGRITLCTCKHKDRATFYPSGNPARPWDEMWVAGLTSKSSSPSRSLAYLMLVEDAFPDQYTLWNHLSSGSRRAKSASYSKIGDLYEPKAGASFNPHDPANYAPPISGHVHAPMKNPTYWHGDITMWRSKTQPTPRPHPLLLGYEELSFRWLRATMRLRSGAMGKSAHHKMFATLDDFVAKLV
jgi:hypothetical protein